MTPHKPKERSGWFADIHDILNNRIGLALIVLAVGNSGRMEIENLLGNKVIHVSEVHETHEAVDSLRTDLNAYEKVDGMAHQDLSDRLGVQEKRTAKINQKGHFYSFNFGEIP